jgi:hypothetical protein
MSMELPDWLRGMLLLGRDGAGNIIPILVDATGQINVLLRGADALGTVRTVRVDNVGQLYAILRGAGGNDVSVDAAGNLAAVLKGIDGFGALHTILVDATGQAIMVPRGASGNYLDVDANGYLTAVLKGIYAGALHTISVDANGRIDAFLMDGADQWGQTLRIGNAELAARLDNLNSYDWRGNVLYKCDFGLGIPAGYNYLDGVGAGVALTPDYFMTGGYSLKLTGGSTLTGQAARAIKIGSPPSAKIGVECSFSYAPGAVRFYILYSYDWGVNRRVFGIAFDFGTNQLEYYNNAGAWTDFQAAVCLQGANSFHHLKVVGDGTTGKYIRGLYQNAEYDMTALSGQSAASLGSDYIDVWIGFWSRGGFNDIAYVDSFIVTTTEP